MDEQVGIDFQGTTNEDGTIDPKTVTLRFKHTQINNLLAKWAQVKVALQRAIDSKEKYESEEEYKAKIAEMTEMCERIKQSLVDSSNVVKKGTEGKVIKTTNKM